MNVLIALLALSLSTTLPTGWRISPAGASIPLDTFPVYAQLLPGNTHALILHSGYKPPLLSVLQLRSRKIVSSVPLPDAGTNFTYDPATRRVFVPLGHHSGVASVRVTSGNELELESTLTIDTPNGHLSTVALSPQYLAVTQTMQDSVAILSPEGGKLIRRVAVPRPTRALFHNTLLYVLSNAPAELHVFRLPDFTSADRVGLSAGPSDMLVHGRHLYVAASSTNFVDILDIGEPGRPQPVERLNVAPTPAWPVGMTPSTLSYDPSEGRIFITCSDANAIAVFDPKLGRVAGYIPTAWYPTYALPVAQSGLLILNGKGERSYPNPQGPNPTVHRSMTPQPPSGIQYTPLIQPGSARLVVKLTPASLSRLSRQYTKLAPAPSRAKAHLPAEIRHVIFIMKENRTYDQVLGDLPQGRGDASLCLFPEKITPNHHKLAREFVLDNFYVNADVSAEGWYWTSAAIVPHFIMKKWPADYAGRTRRSTEPSPRNAPLQQEPMTQAPGGYIWTNAIKAGLSFRNYGFFVSNRRGAKPGEPIVASVSDPALLPYTNPHYAGYDPDFPDLERARIFLSELAEFERTDSLPRLTVMVLPNDHTWGTAPGKLTPFSSVADNDAALGKIVEAVSRSRFWPHTAIFVLEDDAQNGPDHVDSHRSPAYVISPYTRRAKVDSNFYNTTSMLRTIELILGLPPLTHYDATSRPMLTAFQPKPDLRPYEAEAARVSLNETNPPGSTTAARSDALDLSQPDRIDDAEMNTILWLALRNSPPPPPTRSSFLVRRD